MHSPLADTLLPLPPTERQCIAADAMGTPTNLENTHAQDDPDGDCRIPVEKIQGPQRNRHGACNGYRHPALGPALTTFGQTAAHPPSTLLRRCWVSARQPTPWSLEPWRTRCQRQHPGAVAGVYADHVQLGSLTFGRGALQVTPVTPPCF